MLRIGENTLRMRCAAFLVALFILACGSAIACDEPSASPAPSASPQGDGPPDVTVESDPTTRTKTINLEAAYTGSTYGPGNFEITQVIPRVAAFYVGKSVLRLSLPRVETINGHDSGFSDTALFYLFQRLIRPGAGFIGLSAQFPTADSPSFGTGKWMIGPAAAYVFTAKPKEALAGILLQSFFSVVGPASRANQSLVTLLPFATVRIAGAWFLKWPEAPWQFDLQRGSTLIPLGLGVGRMVTLDDQIVLVSISDETAVVHAHVSNAPKNTVRVTFTILVRSDTH